MADTPNFKAKEIAEYISFLLGAVDALNDRVETIQKEKSKVADIATVPYAGSTTSLDPQRYEVVKITGGNQDNKTFTAIRLEPDASDPHWSIDQELASKPLTGYYPAGVSMPSKDIIVPIFYTGAVENEVAKYGYFGSEEVRAGIITGRNFSFPTEANANVYEVDTYFIKHKPVPGFRTITKTFRDTVIAANWSPSPTLLSSGTYVILHRCCGLWIFQPPAPSLSTLTVITSLRVTSPTSLDAYEQTIYATPVGTPTWRTWHSGTQCGS